MKAIVVSLASLLLTLGGAHRGAAVEARPASSAKTRPTVAVEPAQRQDIKPGQILSLRTNLLANQLTIPSRGKEQLRILVLPPGTPKSRISASKLTPQRPDSLPGRQPETRDYPGLLYPIHPPRPVPPAKGVVPDNSQLIYPVYPPRLVERP